MGLHQNIKTAMSDALKARDEIRLAVLRGLVTAFTNELVAQKHKPNEILPDDAALAVIARAAKQRKDSIEQFTQGGRDDLAKREEAELAVLKEYLPEELSREEIQDIVAQKKEALGITDVSQKGQLMGAVMQELKGKADGTTVKEVVDSLLL